MHQMKFALPTLLLLLGLLQACNDPITVGSELLDDDRAGVGEVVDLPFTTRVLREDSLQVYEGSRFNFPGPLTFGQIEDPNFGLTRHSVYLTLSLPRTSTTGLTIVPQFVDRADITVDSVVVLIPIDTSLGFYGPGRTFPYRALQIQQRIPTDEDQYSNFETATQQVDLGFETSFAGTLEPRLVRDTAIRGDSVAQAHVRIRLNESVVQLLNSLDRARFVDSTFLELFPGIHLVPDGPSNALVYLAPNENPNRPVYNGFNVYYRDSLDRPIEYRIPFRLALPSYQYDYSGSLAGTLLDDGTESDLLAVAGRGGLITEIEFTDLSALEDKVINRAELELPLTDLAGVDYTDFPPPGRVELFYRPESDALLQPILDRTELLRVRAGDDNVNFFLGGLLETGGGNDFYSPAFSIHLQRMIRGEVPRKVYLRAYPTFFFSPNPALPPAPLPGRVFLSGPDDAEQPARVRVTFTEVN